MAFDLGANWRGCHHHECNNDTVERTYLSASEFKNNHGNAGSDSVYFWSQLALEFLP
jgi:hypothetical protein